jgi:hypothetical protein
MNCKLYRLIIKGNLTQCLTELSNRKIHVINVTRGSENHSDCSITVESSGDNLIAWFHDESECVQFVGFPAGTLLAMCLDEK